MTKKAEWLKKRNAGIGSSDAGTILGVNPWKTVHQLWLEKTGRQKAKNISDEPAVKYGINAEKHIRELFILDHPELKIEYTGNKIFNHKKYEFLLITPDGHLTKTDGTKGLLEIKTTTVRSNKDLEKWTNEIPQMYYAQCLHGMNVLDYEFTYLRAYIKNIWNNDIIIRDYYFEKNKEEAKYLEKKEIEWWNEYIVKDIEPSIPLPQI